MKKTIVVTALATIIGLTGMYQASAGCEPGNMRGHGGYFGGGMQVRAQLDDATKVKFDKFFDETQDIRRKMVVKRAEIRALMHAEEPNATKVGELSGEIFDLKSSMRAKAKGAGIDEVMSAAQNREGCDGSRYRHGQRGMMRGYKNPAAN